jgi:hypothetical protein
MLSAAFAEGFRCLATRSSTWRILPSLEGPAPPGSGGSGAVSSGSTPEVSREERSSRLTAPTEVAMPGSHTKARRGVTRLLLMLMNTY